MQTLNNLLQEGLVKGTVLKCYDWPLSVAQWTGEQFISVSDDGWHLVGDTIVDDESNGWEKTTAYDAGIHPEDLALPEPLWTGWILSEHPFLDEPVRIEYQKHLYEENGEVWTYRNELLTEKEYTHCLPPNK